MGLTLLGLAACGSEEDEPMVTPASGTWAYVDEGFGENTCGNESLLYRDPSTTFRLDNPGDGTITVSRGTQAAFSCTLDGLDLSCPSRLASQTAVMNTDAVVYFNMRVDAEFSSDTAMSGTQRVDVTCQGSSCMYAPAVLGVALPCYYTINFSANDPGPG